MSVRNTNLEAFQAMSEMTFDLDEDELLCGYQENAPQQDLKQKSNEALEQKSNGLLSRIKQTNAAVKVSLAQETTDAKQSKPALQHGLKLPQTQLSEGASNQTQLSEELSDELSEELSEAASDVHPEQLPELTEADLAALKVIDMTGANRTSAFLHAFLTDVHAVFAANGVAAKHYVLDFKEPADIDRVTAFKRAVSARLSSLRNKARQVKDIAEFWVAITHAAPVAAAGSVTAQKWLVTVAKMDSTNYKTFVSRTVSAERKTRSSKALTNTLIDML